jgi:hypothetical protein
VNIFHDPTGERQPNSPTTLLGRDARFKEMVSDLGGDAGPIVDHTDGRPAVTGRDCDSDMSSSATQGIY